MGFPFVLMVFFGSPLRASNEQANPLMPAFNEFPVINVVQPAYHCAPKGGQGSFRALGNRRFNCMRVFATMDYVSEDLSEVSHRRRLGRANIRLGTLQLIDALA